MIINNKTVSEEKIIMLVSAVKAKKELATADEKFIEAEIVKQLSHDSKALAVISGRETEKLDRAKEFKQIVKQVRSILRRSYGLFQLADIAKRKLILEELRESPRSIAVHEKLLQTHASTAERLKDYPAIYQKIFAITGRPRVLIDLGCGLNPLSFPWMKLEHVDYFASDLSLDDCLFLQQYFDIQGIHGKAIPLNLLELKKDRTLLGIFPKADVCFLFKVLETLELTKSHLISELLLLAAPARFIVASFATKTSSGGRMRNPRRGWIEHMIGRLGYSFEKFETESEIFYIIKTNK